ncbi:hypothetical protein GCM10009740_11600 [Terrabacter terrae]|uniref:DUF1232 domain-containing protein n=1 Tax=Terrabacter terrae TaxID=318434 RepID=A0ABP5FEM8_9MICO
MKTPSRIKMAATVASVVRAATRPGAPSLQERVHAVPRLVRSTLHGAYAGTTLKRLGLVAGAVAYVASPIDLLPEAILPVVGAADDAVVISWVIKAFFDETDRFLAWEAGQGITRRGSGFGAGRGSSPRTTAPGATVSQAPSGSVDPAGSASVGSASVGSASVGSASAGSASAGSAKGPEIAVAGVRPDGAPRPDRDVTGAAAGHGGRGRLPEGVRQAATDYVLESVRKRLER